MSLLFCLGFCKDLPGRQGEKAGGEREGMGRFGTTVLNLCRKTAGKLMWLETVLIFIFHIALQEALKKGQWQKPREGQRNRIVN